MGFERLKREHPDQQVQIWWGCLAAFCGVRPIGQRLKLDKRIFIENGDRIICLHEAASRIARREVEADGEAQMNAAVTTILLPTVGPWTADAKGRVLEAYILHVLRKHKRLDWVATPISTTSGTTTTRKAKPNNMFPLQMVIEEIVPFTGQFVPDKSFDHTKTTLFVPQNSNYPRMSFLYFLPYYLQCLF